MMRNRSQRGATIVEFVGAILVLLLLWAAVGTILQLLSEHNDEYTHMMSSPFTHWQLELPRWIH